MHGEIKKLRYRTIKRIEMSATILKQAALVIVLHVTAGAAFAQFAWVDAKGVRQYSDQPPPASVPKRQILKTPGDAPRDARPEAVAVDASAASAPGMPAALPLTTAEKNADYVKRRSDQAEKDRKAADDVKVAAAKAHNCELARSYARSLESGERIASLDKNGERVFMSDETRAREMRDNRRNLDGCK